MHIHTTPTSTFLKQRLTYLLFLFLFSPSLFSQEGLINGMKYITTDSTFLINGPCMRESVYVGHQVTLIFSDDPEVEIIITKPDSITTVQISERFLYPRIKMRMTAENGAQLEIPVSKDGEHYYFHKEHFMKFFKQAKGIIEIRVNRDSYEVKDVTFMFSFNSGKIRNRDIDFLTN